MKKDQGLVDKKSIRNGLLRQFNDEVYPGSLEVFLVIHAYSEDGKTAQVTIETIAEKTGFGADKIILCLNKLEGKGFIERLRKELRRKPRVYKLVKL